MSSLKYEQLRAKVLRLHNGKCFWSGRKIGEYDGFDVHHLFITRGMLRDVDRAEDIDEPWNCVPLLRLFHKEAHTTAGREYLCRKMYYWMGDGSAWKGHAIVHNLCKHVLTKTEPDLPLPEVIE